MGNNLALENPKWELFCRAWVETLGNGTRSALAAFDITNKELCEVDWKDLSEENKLARRLAENTAATVAREYIRNPQIRKRINQLLDEEYFNDESVKREHYKLIVQDEDLPVKRAAINDYYKLKGQMQEHIDLTTKGERVNNLSPEQIAKLDQLLEGKPDEQSESQPSNQRDTGGTPVSG